jgi:hypothetical protein
VITKQILLHFLHLGWPGGLFGTGRCWRPWRSPAAAAGTALLRLPPPPTCLNSWARFDGQKIALYLDHAGDNSPEKTPG